MKKLTPGEIRGKAAEERFVSLARSLKGSTNIVRVKFASRRLDQHGVDAVVSLRLPSKQILKVPVQVKSSEAGVSEYKEQYPQYVDQGVIIMVVNERRSDEEIRSELKFRLQVVQRTQVSFVQFFASMRKEPGVVSRQRYGKQIRRMREILCDRMVHDEHSGRMFFRKKVKAQEVLHVRNTVVR